MFCNGDRSLVGQLNKLWTISVGAGQQIGWQCLGRKAGGNYLLLIIGWTDERLRDGWVGGWMN